jgi:inosose dehydratase
MRLAAAPISWGVCEVPGWGFQIASDRVLDDAVRLGLREIEAGPPGFLPADPRDARAIVSRRGARVIGGFVTVVLHRVERLEAELVVLERQAAWLAELGSEVLVLAAASGRDNYEVPVELSPDEWRTLLAALPRAIELARRHGLDVALHPHVGTAIETRAAIERILGESDVPLCLDTGHVFVGGTDPAEIARAHARRIRHVHLKDADADLAAAVRGRRLAYAAAVARGLYRPLGDGDVDVAGVLAALGSAGYSGWGVLEQDIALPSAPSVANDPARDIARSRDFVRAHG